MPEYDGLRLRDWLFFINLSVIVLSTVVLAVGIVKDRYDVIQGAAVTVASSCISMGAFLIWVYRTRPIITEQSDAQELECSPQV